MTIKLQDDKSYLANNGRIVKLFVNKNNSNEFIDPTHGNVYNWQGVVVNCGISSWIGESFQIVEELPFYLPCCPQGFKWANGYATFRRPKEGEYFIRWNTKTGFGDVVKCSSGYSIPFGVEDRRLIVEPVAQKIADNVCSYTTPRDQYSVAYKEKPQVAKETKAKLPAVFKSSDAYTYWNIAKKSPSLKSRALAYWIIEPFHNFVRVAVFGGIIYSYNHADEIKSFISSCIPTVKIELPEVLD